MSPAQGLLQGGLHLGVSHGLVLQEKLPLGPPDEGEEGFPGVPLLHPAQDAAWRPDEQGLGEVQPFPFPVGLKDLGDLGHLRGVVQDEGVLAVGGEGASREVHGAHPGPLAVHHQAFFVHEDEAEGRGEPDLHPPRFKGLEDLEVHPPPRGLPLQEDPHPHPSPRRLPQGLHHVHAAWGPEVHLDQDLLPGGGDEVQEGLDPVLGLHHEAGRRQGQGEEPEQNEETPHGQPKHTRAFRSVRASASAKGRPRASASFSRVKRT